jgi:hypothetical protein
MHPSRVDGLAMFAAVGDSVGRLYILTPQQGSVVAEHDAGSGPSPPLLSNTSQLAGSSGQNTFLPHRMCREGRGDYSAGQLWRGP